MQACPFGLDHRNLCMGRKIDERISGDTFGRAASQVDRCLLFLNIFSGSKVVTFQRHLVSQQKKVKKAVKINKICDVM